MNISRYLVALTAALGGMVLAMPAIRVQRRRATTGWCLCNRGTSTSCMSGPNADMARYQKVMIDPVTVEFSKEWDKSVNDTRYVTRVRPEDARRIAEETTGNVGGILADALRDARLSDRHRAGSGRAATLAARHRALCQRTGHVPSRKDEVASPGTPEKRR